MSGNKQKTRCELIWTLRVCCYLVSCLLPSEPWHNPKPETLIQSVNFCRINFWEHTCCRQGCEGNESPLYSPYRNFLQLSKESCPKSQGFPGLALDCHCLAGAAKNRGVCGSNPRRPQSNTIFLTETKLSEFFGGFRGPGLHVCMDLGFRVRLIDEPTGL